MSKELLNFVSKLHDSSVELLKDLSFDKRLEADGYVMCLYASLIELAGGIIVLIEKDRRTALSAGFRTFLEAYVDFRNIVADPAYLKNCYARHHKDWIKVLKEDAEPNPYLEAIHGHADREEALQRHSDELERLKVEGVAPLNIITRLKRVGMLDEYRSIYAFESNGAHNSLQALISRHIDMAQNDYGLALYKQQTLDDYRTHLDSTAGLLMDASRRIHERMKSEHQKDVQALSDELEALRKAYA